MEEEQIQLKFFAEFIEKEIGIIYPEENYYQLKKRLGEISEVLGFHEVDKLWNTVQQGVTEEVRRVILEIATNNETSFFRDSRLFSILGKYIIPELLSRQGSGSLKIWSAACSTGQEPYSVAIILRDLQKIPFTILATDICETVLEKAKRGEYTQLEVQRGMPASTLIKHFEKCSDDLWRVNSYLKEGIRFEACNLIRPWRAHGMFEIIFCRNVLIYQNIERKKEIITRIAEHIVPGGFLILGSAENISSLSNLFEQKFYDGALVYVRLNR
ncbi:MAG: protein-glutamate O-methyltransferase CheR [Oligoflexia bacterium]|nr:protein-glutamate O-methyltransferase CheR [Oligoflexia bacterium]MBF0366326.1 protein-glutamate O-methyltransferase CheR [Oligoflexia bacterium]